MMFLESHDRVNAVRFWTPIRQWFAFPSQNRLFSSICNSSWFINTAMILFLNKKDLFLEKIQRVNITTCFPDYEGWIASLTVDNPKTLAGAQNYDEAVNFIKMKFAELNQHPDKWAERPKWLGLFCFAGKPFTCTRLAPRTPTRCNWSSAPSLTRSSRRICRRREWCEGPGWHWQCWIIRPFQIYSFVPPQTLPVLRE